MLTTLVRLKGAINACLKITVSEHARHKLIFPQMCVDVNEVLPFIGQIATVTYVTRESGQII